MQQFLSREAEQLELGWWVVIATTKPDCTYYFGSFSSPQEAKFHTYGYIEDLKQEGSQEIAVEIKYCQPEALTIFEHSKLD